MTESERPQFAKILGTTYDLHGRRLNDDTTELWWAALAGYDFALVRGAFSRHIQNPDQGQYCPKPADIIREIGNMADTRSGHPGIEEAWAIVGPSLNNEGLTVVWTEQIAQAFGVAVRLQDDPVAARMAFKESYTGLLAQARQSGAPPRWFPSMGTDVGGREGPLVEAVSQGRLGADHVRKLLPYREGLGSPALEALVNKTAKKLIAA